MGHYFLHLKFQQYFAFWSFLFLMLYQVASDWKFYVPHRHLEIQCKITCTIIKSQSQKEQVTVEAIEAFVANATVQFAKDFSIYKLEIEHSWSYRSCETIERPLLCRDILQKRQKSCQVLYNSLILNMLRGRTTIQLMP